MILNQQSVSDPMAGELWELKLQKVLVSGQEFLTDVYKAVQAKIDTELFTEQQKR